MGEVIAILSTVQNSGGMLAVMVYYAIELRYLRRDFEIHAKHG